MNKIKEILSSRLSRLTVLLTALLTAVWQMTAGDILDDYPYRHIVQEAEVYGGDTARAADAFWGCEGEITDSASDVFSSLPTHYELVNGRLANMLRLLSNLIADPITDILHGLAMWLMLTMLMRLITPDWRRLPLLTAVATVAVWIVLPWEDGLASSDFMMNYLWSSALNLAFFCIMLRLSGSGEMLGFNNGCRADKNKTAWLKTAGLAVAGFFIGQMHEGFSIPFCLGYALTALKLLRAGRLSASICIPLAAYLLGTLTVMLSPALAVLYNSRQASEYEPGFFVYFIGIRLWPLWLSVAMMIVSGLRRHRFDRLSLLLTAIALASVATGIMAHQSARALWTAYLLSIIIAGRSLSGMAERKFSGVKSIMAACVMLLAGSVWLSLVAYYQHRFSLEHEAVRESLRIECTNIAYVDLSLPGDMPWYLMEVPQYLGNIGESSRANLAADFFGKSSARIVILPGKFRGVPFDSLPAVAGSEEIRGEYPTFYSPRRLEKSYMMLRFGNPSVYPPTGSVNPVYGLSRLMASIKGEMPAEIQVGREMEEIGVEVTDEMRRRGICSADTAWFYRVVYIGRSLYGLPFLGVF